MNISNILTTSAQKDPGKSVAALASREVADLIESAASAVSK